MNDFPDQNSKMFPFLGLPATSGPVGGALSGPVTLPLGKPPAPLLSKRALSARASKIAPPADPNMPGFDEGGDVYVDSAADEEERQRLEREAQANAGDVPVPAAPWMAPSYAEKVQAAAAQYTPEIWANAALEAAQSGYGETVAPVLRDIAAQYAGANQARAGEAAPPQVNVGREDTPLRSEGTLRGQLMQADPERSGYGTLTDPSRLATAGLTVGLGTAGWLGLPGNIGVAGLEKLGVDVPRPVETALQNAPYVLMGPGGALTKAAVLGGTVAGSEALLNAPAAPGHGNVANLLNNPDVRNIAGQVVGGIGGAAAPSALTGLRAAIAESATRGLESRAVAPAAQSATTAAENVLRANRAEAGIAGGAQPAFGPGSRGGKPGDTAFNDAVHQQSTVPLEDQLQASLAAKQTPAPVLPTERYPSIPEGTMGKEFPEARDMQARSERPIDPNSPAARMGAPLAYDPQYIPGTREYVAREAYEAGLAGGGVRPTPPVGDVARPVAPDVTPPPPASLLTPEVGQLNPPGTGAQLRSDIANSETLSQAQRDFLNSPNGQAAAAQRDAALAGQAPIPEVTANATRTVAKDMGVQDDVAGRVADYMKRSQEATYNVYSSPQGAARVTAGMEAVAHRVEGTFTGNEPDSFINAILSEKTAMENALSHTKATREQVAATVDKHVSDMVQRHYPDNPEKAQATFQKLAGLEARAQVLEKDFKLWTAANDALKNTVASVGDFAVVGVNGLVELAQAGPAMALGTLNRAVNGVAAILHHPSLLDFERVTNLPNLIAKEAHGLPFRYGGEGFRTGKDAPTLLGIGGSKNPLSPIDKHIVQPVINFNNKLQFDMVQGWAKNSISDGLLTQEYVRKWAEGMVKTQSLSGANDFAMAYVSRPDVLRDIARFTRNATSSTSTATAPGRAMAENLTPFSAAYTRGQFARLADMAKLAAPGASETQRVLAASAILSTLVFSAGIYKFANDKFGTTEAQLDPTKPGYGRIVLEGGQVVSMAPQSSVRNAFVNSMEAIKDKRPEDIKGILAQTAIARLAPLFSDALKLGTGYGYDTQGNFYSPFKDDGAKMPGDERLKASAPLPFTAGPILFNGQPVFSLETGLNVAGFNPYNEKMSTQAYRERQDAAQVRHQALVNKDLLQTAFANNPEMVSILMGREWGALEHEEKLAILKALPPEMAKQIGEADAASLAANKEKPTAVGNAIEIRNRTDANIEKLNQEIKAKAEPLQEALFNGKADPRVVAKAVEDLKDYRSEKLAQALWAGSTTYTGLPWKEGSDKKPPQSAIEQAMAEYRNLGSMVKPTAEGKFNYDALTNLQSKYLLDLAKSDPDTAARLSFINTQRVAQAEANKPEIIKLYDFVSKQTREYWDQPYGTKTTYLRDHPQTDAWLNLVGWMPGLHSPQAAVDLYRLAPERSPVFAR